MEPPTHTAVVYDPCNGEEQGVMPVLVPEESDDPATQIELTKLVDDGLLHASMTVSTPSSVSLPDTHAFRTNFPFDGVAHAVDKVLLPIDE